MSLQVRELLTVLILSGVPYLFWIGQSYALPLDNRSISISTATPSAVASYMFSLTPNSAGNVGSIAFQFCDNSPRFNLSCNAPSGLSLGSVGLGQQAGNTGFSIDSNNSSSNRLVISRQSTAIGNVPSDYTFTGIVNPSTVNQTTYVRISTYVSSDGTGSYIDNGSVAYSTSTNFDIGAYIPPYLNFCTGVTVAIDCSQTNGDSLDLGVLNTHSPNTATSQFAGSTNDLGGYGVYILGSTMTSGNDVINPLTNPSISHPGTAEFGLNLRHNSSPSIGNDPVGNGTTLPSSNYGSSNLFSFVSGSLVAGSNEPTEYNRMTATYLVNVPGSQAPGVYATTLTYLASAQF